MIDLQDKCVTIKCSREAMELLANLEFVWEGEEDAFSCVNPWASFECRDDENVGTLKLTPSFLECLCNGGHCVAFDNEYTLFTTAEHPIDYEDEEDEEVTTWMEGTMICDTVWDEPPEMVVFKCKHDWPYYVPERTASIVKVPRQSHVALGHYECGGCGATIDAGDRYCRKCGTRLNGASE